MSNHGKNFLSKMFLWSKLCILGNMLFLLQGCFWSTAPVQDIPPVTNFDAARYMGKWFEIARLPHSFEDGCNEVYAIYSLENNGKINVLNHGEKNGKINEVHGHAFLKDSAQSTTGCLKVTFFWPFYGEYRIILLDDNYEYVVVSSSTKNYLWILARSPKLDEATRNKIIEQLRLWNFEVDKLIFPIQEKNFKNFSSTNDSVIK